MQMHHAVGLSGKPFADLGTSGRQPEIVHMKHANAIAPGLLHAEIGLCCPGLQIGTVLPRIDSLSEKLSTILRLASVALPSMTITSIPTSC
jgi:hypothetical protein